MSNKTTRRKIKLTPRRLTIRELAEMIAREAFNEHLRCYRNGQHVSGWRRDVVRDRIEKILTENTEKGLSGIECGSRANDA